MNILHTESSKGWGGQEIRILKEAEGLRARGHNVYMAVACGGALIAKARQKGFNVFELPMQKKSALKTILQLQKIIRDLQIDIVNTHSSWDAWIGGLAARLLGKKLVRTRHLSTRIKGGINGRVLYKGLADFVVTTSSCVIDSLSCSSSVALDKMRCVATGVDPTQIQADQQEIDRFRQMLVLPGEILIGTACFVRSWKGIMDLLHAAKIVKKTHPHIKWVVVGGGYYKEYLGALDELDVKDVVTFTGHLESPYSAIAAFDIFTLLSTAHEGISQASLQAAYLERPLITTDIGGLPEVCIEGKTGFIVPSHSPEKVAQAVIKLASDPTLRSEMGRQAKILVEKHYTLEHMLDQMEEVYAYVMGQAGCVVS